MATPSLSKAQLATIREAVLPLMALADTIDKMTRLRPTAVMLPKALLLSVPLTEPTVLGVPVIEGDRAALIFEPPRGH